MARSNPRTPWWKLPLDEQDAAMEAEARDKRRGIANIRRAIGEAFARGDVFSTPNSFPRGGYTLVHRSTKRRPGVKYQLTWMDDDGPVGDTEPKTLSAAAERVWEDLTGEQKADWIDAKKKSGNPGLSAAEVEHLPVGSIVFRSVDGRPDGGALVVIPHGLLTPIAVLPERSDGMWPGGDPVEAWGSTEFLLVKEGRGRLPTHPTAQRTAQKWWDERSASPAENPRQLGRRQEALLRKAIERPGTSPGYMDEIRVAQSLMAKGMLEPREIQMRTGDAPIHEVYFTIECVPTAKGREYMRTRNPREARTAAKLARGGH